MKKSLFLFLLMILFTGSSTVSFARDIVPLQKEYIRAFGAGINISCFEKYWRTTQQILKSDYVNKINLSHSIGFKSIRIPIAFDLFLKADSVTFLDDFLNAMSEVNETARLNGQNVIFTYHYGKIGEKQVPEEIERISRMWKQIIELFKDKDTNRLFFEVYNEPTIETGEWHIIAFQLMQKVRLYDADRIWIIGGTDYNSVDELLKMKVIPDPKIIYTFHFYQPYMFTHQGAPWTIDKTYLTGLPYPFDETDMPLLPDRALKTGVEYNYRNYFKRGTHQFIKDRMQRIYEWSLKNNVPVICTETGVIKSVKKQHRNNYLRDVINSSYKHGIPVMVWDLDRSFAVIDTDKKELRAIAAWIRYNKIEAIDRVAADIRTN